MQTKTGLGLAVVLSACTASPTETLLPSATFTPHLESQASSVACGEDVAFNGSPTADLAYGFSYDAAGRITHAGGTWSDGTVDSIDYGWNGDNFAHMLSVSGYGSQSEIAANYDVSNNLVDYTWSYTDPSYQESWSYAFSNFLAPNQPTREEITGIDQATFGYELVYDGSNRLIEAVPDSGASTTWAYDDAARTITIDTASGAFTGVITYDDGSREVSATWGGSDPAAIDSEEGYLWNGDQLLSETYRSGSAEAPHSLDYSQVGTVRYTCAAARQHAGSTTRGMSMRGRIGR